MNPIINSNHLEFGIKGLFFEEGKAEVEPASTPPVLPYLNLDNKAGFQAFISGYAFDSAATTFIKTHGLDLFWVTQENLPESLDLKVPFTTSGIDPFFPGLEAMYGKDLPVFIEIEIQSLKNFHSTESASTFSIHSNIGMNFWVTQANGTNA